MELHEEVRRLLIQRLESLHRAGVQQLPRCAERATVSPAPDAAGPPQQPAPAPEHRSPVPAPHYPSPAGQPVAASAAHQEGLMARTHSAADRRARDSAAVPSAAACGGRLSASQRQAALNVLQEQVAACAVCPELARSRTQTVFGVGHLQPRLCFLGEAPGADEDRQGEPFVGRAGQLLNRILAACKLQRQDVYILNILKCRPPGNRTPSPDEAENCRGFLEQQLDVLQPEFICCLGATAAQNLLQTRAPLGKLRGKFYDWRGIQVAVTYHPAYLLRNPAAKRGTWEDMQMLMKAMGQELTS